MPVTACPECGYENATGQKFCGECGAGLASRCPRCGTVIPLGLDPAMRDVSSLSVAAGFASPGP